MRRELASLPSNVAVVWPDSKISSYNIAELADVVEACGVRCVVAPTIMHTPEHSAALASLLLDAGRPSGASRGARP